MKVFITGATGFVGSHTALALLAAGHECHLLVRNIAAAQAYFQQHSQQQPQYIVADMLDSETVKAAMLGFDAVVHAAALVDLDPRHAEQTLQGNLQGITSVIGSACELGIKKILYVSSVSVMMHTDQAWVDESSALITSKDAYSASKIACEQRVRDYQAAGYPVAITYPGGVIGPDDPKLSQVNDALLEMLMIMVPLTTSGIQLVDVRDLAQLQKQLLESDVFSEKENARYIIGGNFVPWADIAKALVESASIKPRCIKIPGWGLRLCGTVMDLLRCFIHVDVPMTVESTHIATKSPQFSSAKIAALMEVSFRPSFESIKDTCQWLESSGRIAARQSR